MTKAVASLSALAAATALAAPAAAEGSNGTLGAPGERTDWPCAGCITRAPASYSPATPIPTIITLHGDEGDPEYIHWRMETPAMNAGALLVSLMCPRDHGCDLTGGSWWRWEDTPAHDPTWVGAQVDRVEAEYNVELQQVYLVGFSGGSSYLSNYARKHTDRFAGVLYLSGGYAPWNGNCSEPCKIPAYFLIGSLDFLLDGARELRDYYMGCGHDVEYVEVPGVDHTIIKDGLPAAVDWLLARPHQCRIEPPPPAPHPPDAGLPPGPPPDPPPDPGPDAGAGPGPDPDPGPGPTGTGCSAAPDCDACEGCYSLCVCTTGQVDGCAAACDTGGTPPPAAPPSGPGSSEEGTGDSGGCGCRAPARGSRPVGAWLVLAAAAIARRRRRR